MTVQFDFLRKVSKFAGHGEPRRSRRAINASQVCGSIPSSGLQDPITSMQLDPTADLPSRGSLSITFSVQIMRSDFQA